MKPRSRKMLSAAIACGTASLAAQVMAVTPIAYTSGDYIETFDTLPFLQTQVQPYAANAFYDVPQADGTPLPGWQFSLGAGGTFTVDNGSSTAKNFVGSLGYNEDPAFPERDITERALGATSTTGAPLQQVALVLENKSTTTYTSFNLVYTGETWRLWDETRNAAAGMQFQILTGPNAQINSAGFQDVDLFDFTPLSQTGNQAVDGNDPANQKIIGVNPDTLEELSFSRLMWKPGERLVLRWQNPNGGGNEDTIGIDNLRFTAGVVPPPPQLKWDVAKGSGTWNTDPNNRRWRRTDNNAEVPFTERVSPELSDITNFSDNPPTANAITVTVADSGVRPTELNVTHTAGTYVLTGGAVIGAPLTKSGAGTLVIATPQQFSNVNINGGVIDNQATGTLGSGVITATGGTLRFSGTPQTLSQGTSINNGTLTLEVPDLSGNFDTDLDVQGAVGGTGQLIKTGAGRLHLNTYGPMTNGLLDIREGYVTAGGDWAGDDDVMRIAAGAVFDESFGNGESFGTVEGDGIFVIGQGVHIRHNLNTLTRHVFNGLHTVGFQGTISDGQTVESLQLTEFVKSGQHTLVLTNPASDFISSIHLRRGVLEVPILNDRNQPSPIGRGNTVPLAPGADIILGALEGTSLRFGTLRYTGPSTKTDRTIVSDGAGAGGAIEITNADTVLTYNGALTSGSDTAPIVKSGPGTLVINSDQSAASGTFAVNGGKLVIRSISSGTQEPIFFGAGLGQTTVRTEQGGTLTGDGVINGTIRSTFGGAINPGDVGTIGTLSASALNLDGATLNFDLNAGTGTSDKLNITSPNGASTQTGLSFFNFNNLGGTLTAGQEFVLIDYNGTGPDPALFEASQFNIDGKGLLIVDDPARTAIILRISGTPVEPPQWNVDADGNWSVASNWRGAVPNAVSAHARFLGKITANRTVTVDQNITVGTMTFANGNASYTIAGTTGNTLTLDNGTRGPALIEVLAGTHNISATLAVPTNLNVQVNPSATLNVSSALTVAQPGTLTKTGGGAANFTGGVNLTGAASVVNVNEGTLNGGNLAGTRDNTPAEPNRFLGDVNVAAGATLAANHIRIDDLTASGTVALARSGGANDTPSNNGTSVVEVLSLGETAAAPDPVGKFDIGNNKLIIKGDNAEQRVAQLAQVRNALIKGRNAPVGGVSNGKWDGATGITSSAAVAENGGGAERRSVGYALNGDLLGKYSTFGGEPVDDTDILVRYTRNGDANLDGVVNNNDITILAGFYRPGTTGRHWYQGDFNYDGTVDNNDITILAGFYAPSATPIASPEGAAGLVAVPEPGTAAVLAVGALGLLARRRRNA